MALKCIKWALLSSSLQTVCESFQHVLARCSLLQQCQCDWYNVSWAQMGEDDRFECKGRYLVGCLSLKTGSSQYQGLSFPSQYLCCLSEVKESFRSLQNFGFQCSEQFCCLLLLQWVDTIARIMLNLDYKALRSSQCNQPNWNNPFCVYSIVPSVFEKMRDAGIQDWFAKVVGAATMW